MKAIKWIGIVLGVLTVLFFTISLTVGTQPEEGFMSERMEEIESYMVHRDVSNTSVSYSDIAWQVDHTLKAIINITQTLEDSDPNSHRLTFNFARTIFFTYGDFPRGVAKAPASVTPPDVITDEALVSQLELAREKTVLIQNISEKSSFPHDTFGLLDRDQAARLIEVHTDHHLKIIRDILEAEGIEAQ